MVHWGWLIIVGILGMASGVLLMAILTAGSFADVEFNHFTETKHLRDEIQYLESKLIEKGDSDEQRHSRNS